MGTIKVAFQRRFESTLGSTGGPGRLRTDTTMTIRSGRMATTTDCMVGSLSSSTDHAQWLRLKRGAETVQRARCPESCRCSATWKAIDSSTDRTRSSLTPNNPTRGEERWVRKHLGVRGAFRPPRAILKSRNIGQKRENPERHPLGVLG